jgi:peptidoglycan hydrolase-like protein with peptidoglycan-binding domain
MRFVRYAVAVGLLGGLGACSNMMGGGSSSRDTAMATPPPVAPDMVRQVQSRLRDGGYYKQGAVDGVWGSATQASVRSFQQDHNLSSNGQLDVPTLQALNLAGGPVSNTDARDTRPTQPTYNPPRSADTAPADQPH